MRSRYSAYAKGNAKFVVLSTHPENPSFEGSTYNGEFSSTLLVRF
jgi:uncharacterized protein YchJ